MPSSKLKRSVLLINYSCFKCDSEVMPCTAVAYSVFTTRMDAKVTPTDDTDYSCYINPQNSFNRSYRLYIMPLVIYSLGGRHTSTQAYRHSVTEAILRNLACLVKNLSYYTESISQPEQRNKEKPKMN